MNFDDFFLKDGESLSITNPINPDGSTFINEKTSKFAATIIYPNNPSDGHIQISLMRESDIPRTINHPAILKFKTINFQSYDEPTILQPAIITKYLPHGSLAFQLDAERNSTPDSQWTSTKKFITLVGVADAMRHLHSLGIIHRDLKPENILLDDNFYPLILDLDLASKSGDDSFSMTKSVGTSLYMAPESLNDDYDKAVDVFSFSIIAYEVISGCRPFNNLKIENQIDTRPKKVSSITEKMWNLLEQCWNVDPKQRPSFDYIYTELSTDVSYFAEPINKVEFKKYVSILDHFESSGYAAEKITTEKTKICERSLYEDEERPKTRLPRMQEELEGLREEIRNYQQQIKELKDELKRKKCRIIQLEQTNLDLQSQHEISIRKANESLIQFSEESRILRETNDAFYTGLMNILGPEKSCDPTRAFNALDRASEAGNRYASFIIGLMLEVGQLVQKDIPRAINYYQKSFDQGNTKGYNRIGFLYVVGTNIPKNYKAAYEYFKTAADLGDPFAINNLGFLYQNGLHVSQSFQKAVELFEQAAGMHEPFSLYNLGKMYEQGIFFDQNSEKARYYYSEATRYGHPTSGKFS